METGQLFIPGLPPIPLWWDNESGEIFLVVQDQFFAVTMEQLTEIVWAPNPQLLICLLQECEDLNGNKI